MPDYAIWSADANAYVAVRIYCKSPDHAIRDYFFSLPEDERPKHERRLSAEALSDCHKAYTVVLHGDQDDYRTVWMVAPTREAAEVAAAKVTRPKYGKPEDNSLHDAGYSVCAVFPGFCKQVQ